MYFDDGLIIRRSRLWLGGSGTLIRVDHTERTWGVDIESLLTGHVKTLFKSQAGKKKFIYKHSGEIGFITGMLFFLGAIAGVILSSSRFIASYLDKVHAIASETASAAALLSTKLDFLIELISTGAWPRFIFSVIVFLIISFILSILLGVYVSTQADNQPRSYVLLSKTVQEERTKYIDKHRRDWLMFSISIIVSIITGIASNIIFTKYFGVIG